MTTIVTVGADDPGLGGPVPREGAWVRFRLSRVRENGDRYLSADEWRVLLDDTGAGESEVPDSVDGVGLWIDSSIQGWQAVVVAGYPATTQSLVSLVRGYQVDPSTLQPLPAGSTALELIDGVRATANAATQAAADATATAGAATDAVAGAVSDAGDAKTAAAAAVEAASNAEPAGLSDQTKTDLSATYGAEIETDGTPANGATSALIAAALAAYQGGGGLSDDAGVLLSSRLAAKVGNITMALLGDSTGNDLVEWYRLSGFALAARNAALTVKWTVWDDPSQAYPALTNMQTGSGSTTGGIVVNDTFTRTGELVGSGTPAWAGSTGQWSTNGTAALPAATGVVTCSGGVAGSKMTARFLGVTLDTTPGASSKEARFYAKYLSASNHVYVSIAVSSTGVVTASIWKRIANTATNLGSFTALGLTANTVNTFDVLIDVDGLNVTGTINGVVKAVTLASGDDTAIAAATAIALGLGNSAMIGSVTVGAVQCETPVVLTGQTLTLYNGSFPGSTFAYQSARLAAMLPVTPDVVVLSSSHNYGAGDSATYVSVVTDLVTAIHALYPNALIVASGQNPEFNPRTADQIAGQVGRITELRILANKNGWGYVPVLETFRAQSDGGLSIVQTDGIHPTVSPTGGPNGSTLWRDAFIDWIDGHAARV